MRLFVAVAVGEQAGEKLASVIAAASQMGLDASFSNPGQLHCTLAFLGEKSEKEKDAITAKLSSVRLPPFAVSCRGLGFFPSDKFARVFWAGLEGRELMELQAQIAAALDCKDGRPFHPHVTLARLKGNNNLEKLAALARQPNDFGPFQVGSFKLMKSELSPQGAVHSVAREFALL